MRLARWFTHLAVALLPLSGCTCAESSAPPAPAVAKPAVPAPEGLVLELVVRSPDRLLTEIREAMAGPMLLLPKTVGGMAVNLFGLPVTAAELFDEALPLVGGSLAESKGADITLHTAIAIHVKDGRRFVDRLTKGTDATFDAETEGELTLLTARENLRAARLEARLAVVDNYLVAGDDVTALRRLGPYLARTLARADVADADLVVQLKGADAVTRLGDRLAALKIPPEAIPAGMSAVIDPASTVEGLRRLLGQIDAVEVVANLDPKAELVVDVSLEAKGAVERATLAGLPTIAPGRMLTLPEGTVGAVTWVPAPGAEEEDAARRSEQLRASLALTADDTTALKNALIEVGEGRGGRTLLGLRCTGVGLTGLAEGDVRDPARLAEGVKALTDVVQRPTLKERLAAEKMAVEISVGRARHIPDDVHLVRLTKSPPPDGDPPAPVDLRYVVAADRFYAAAGSESLAVLQHLHEPDPERRWGLASTMKAAIGRLGDTAWLALAADPYSLNACLHGQPGGTFSTPITFVVGPSQGGANARLEIAAGLLRFAGRELF